MIATKKPCSDNKAARKYSLKGNTKITNSYRKSDHSVDNYLLDWTSRNLPNNRTYFITDVDLIIRDIRGKTENLMLVEVKRFSSNVEGCQKSTFSILHKLIIAGLKALQFHVRCKKGINHKIKYHGFNLLQFERTSFEDGSVYWNGQIITESNLIKKLSFE